MGRRYLGFAFLLAIWLIVLSVPSLRLMLQRQSEELLRLTVGSDDNERESPWSQYFNGPPDFAWLTARYPNDVRVLAKVLEWQASRKRERLW
ncbi:MAG: hypothetical protein M3347_02995, partial [Armatimonadota bacterium]|nr:hypothetical protein [Armatimonadota bacterium]